MISGEEAYNSFIGANFYFEAPWALLAKTYCSETGESEFFFRPIGAAIW